MWRAHLSNLHLLCVVLVTLCLVYTPASHAQTTSAPVFVAGGPSFALQFDGLKGQVVTLPGTHNLTTFTSEIHFKAHVLDVYNAVLVGKGSWRLYRCGNTNNLCYYTAGVLPSTLQSSRAINDNRWHHVAVTLTQTSPGSLQWRKEIYFDGTLDKSELVNGRYQVTVTPYTIGDDSSSGTTTANWNGQLDVFREWNTVRNSTEISLYYNTLVIPQRTNLIAEYNFNEGAGLTTKSEDGSKSATIASSVQWVPSGASITGGSIALEVPANQAIVFSLLAPGAFTASLTSLPPVGSLYQVNPDGTQNGGAITDSTAFVSDAQGRLMYVAPSTLGTYSFSFILEDRTNRFNSASSVSIVVGTNLPPVASPALYAGRFNGGSYMSIENANGDFDTLDFTFEAWVLPRFGNSVGERGCLFATMEGGAPRVGFYLRYDLGAVFVHFSGTEYMHPLPLLTSGTYIHLALTFAKSAISCAAGGVNEYFVYLNGESVGTGPTIGLASPKAWTSAFDKELRIGHSGALNTATNSRNDFFVGDMDEVRVYSNLIGFRTIQANMFKTKALNIVVQDGSDPLNGKTLSMLGYWDFDSGPLPRHAGVAFDIGSGQHRAAKLVGVTRTASQVDFNRVTATADSSIAFTLQGYDVDTPGGIKTATVLSVPNAGTLTLESGTVTNATSRLRLLANATGAVITPGALVKPTDTLLYFPPNNVNTGGRPFTTFTYSVTDGLLTSGTTTVSIDVKCKGGAFPSPGTNECTVCPAGTSSQSVTSSLCQPCPQGSYSAVNGSATCTLCSPGYYQPLTGQTSCLPCANGTSTNGLAGAGVCTTCGPGYFAPTSATAACSLCAINEYQPAAGSASCLSCPYGKQSKFKNVVPATALSDCICAPGFFQTNTSISASCVDCPGGGSCEGGDVAPLASKGYWNSGNASNVFYECPSRDACLGNGAQSCAFPHTGVQCASCQDGYYRTRLSCYKCAPAYGFWFFVLLCVYIGSVYAVYAVASRPIPVDALSTVGGIGSTIGIFITSFQFTALLTRLKVGWPTWAFDYMSHLSVFAVNLEALGLDCLGSSLSPTAAWVLRVLSPFIVVITLAIGAVLGRLHEKFVAKVGPDYQRKHPQACQEPPSHASLGRKLSHWWASLMTQSVPGQMTDYVNAMHLYLSFAYVYLVEAVFEAFECQEQANGDWTWVPDPSMTCWAGGTWMWIFVGALVCVTAYVIGIPAFWFLKARTRYVKGENALYVRKVIRSGAVLWLPFKRDYFGWILVRTLKKFAIPFFIVTFATHSSVLMQLLIISILLFAAVSLQAVYRPYKLNVNNHAEFILGASNVVLIFLAFIYSAKGSITTTKSLDGLSDALVGLMLFSPPSVLVIYVVWYLYRAWHTDPDIRGEQNDLAVRVMCHTFKQVSTRPDAIKYVQNKTSDDDRTALRRLQLILDNLVGHTRQERMDDEFNGEDAREVELIEAKEGLLGGSRSKKKKGSLPPLERADSRSQKDQETPLPGIRRDDSMNNVVP